MTKVPGILNILVDLVTDVFTLMLTYFLAFERSELTENELPLFA